LFYWNGCRSDSIKIRIETLLNLIVKAVSLNEFNVTKRNIKIQIKGFNGGTP